MLAVAVVFGVVIGKEVFGGTRRMKILESALTIRAFFILLPILQLMSGDKVFGCISC